MDAITDYAAWLLPFLLSIVGIWVGVKVPKENQRRTWFIWLCAAFIGIGLLTLYQQYRARKAHDSELTDLRTNLGTDFDTKLKKAGDAQKVVSDAQTQILTNQNAELKRAIENIGSAVHVHIGSGSITELADQILARIDPVWNMTPDEKTRLAAQLSRVPQESRFKVRLLLLPANQQSHTYADDLSGVLHQNGYDGERVTDYSLDSNLTGLSVIVPNGTKSMSDVPEKTRELVTTLQRARIPFILRPPGTSTQYDSPAIVVGMKPTK